MAEEEEEEEEEKRRRRRPPEISVFLFFLFSLFPFV